MKRTTAVNTNESDVVHTTPAEMKFAEKNNNRNKFQRKQEDKNKFNGDKPIKAIKKKNNRNQDYRIPRNGLRGYELMQEMGIEDTDDMYDATQFENYE